MKILNEDLEKQLLIRLNQGEESAFNSIYKAYSKPLFLRVLQMTKSEDDTEELIQELFVKIWESRAEISNIRSFVQSSQSWASWNSAAWEAPG